MKVGYLGLGHMGKAQATRLTENGTELMVWNRTPEKAEGLDAQLLDSPARVAESCDIVFMCLFDSQSVREVLSGDEGVLAASGGSDTVLVDCTTNDVASAVEFHSLAAEAGMQYLEAPVIGSVQPALEGRLVMLVSGDANALAVVRGLLDTLAREVIHLPAPGQATTMKLANNLLLGTWMASLAESVATAEAAGMTAEEALGVLEYGVPGGHFLLEAKKRMMLTGEYPASFEARAILKDLRNVQRLGAEYGMANPMAHAAADLFEQTEHAGRAGEDFASVFETVRTVNE